MAYDHVIIATGSIKVEGTACASSLAHRACRHAGDQMPICKASGAVWSACPYSAKGNTIPVYDVAAKGSVA